MCKAVSRRAHARVHLCGSRARGPGRPPTRPGRRTRSLVSRHLVQRTADPHRKDLRLRVPDQEKCGLPFSGGNLHLKQKRLPGFCLGSTPTFPASYMADGAYLIYLTYLAYRNAPALSRKYMKCIYTYNKIDMLALHQVDQLARTRGVPTRSIPFSRMGPIPFVSFLLLYYVLYFMI